jgi:uncharacterized protein involved in exopolysaccharide biosynthesis
MEPNDIQRQLLADRINDVSRRVDNYTKAIADLERKLAVKRAYLEALEKELAGLNAGINW